MKRDKWSRKHLTTADTNFLEYLAHKHSTDTPQDPLEILIQKEEGEPESERIADRFSWDEVEKLLSETDVKILWDYYYEGKTLHEIVQALGYKTPSAVWKRKKQAIKTLREYYVR